MKQPSFTTLIILFAFSASAQDDISFGAEAVSAPAQQMLTQVIFGGGFFGTLIWLLLFATSTIAIAVAIRLLWGMRKSCFADADSCVAVDDFCRAQNLNDAYGVTYERKDLYSTAMNTVFTNYHDKDLDKEELVSGIVDKHVRGHVYDLYKNPDS